MYEKIAQILKNAPRVNLQNVKPNPFSKKSPKKHLGQHGRKKGKYRMNHLHPKFGYEPGLAPFIKRIPKYGYNRDSHLKRDYEPLTLWQLQRLVDLGRIDTSQPVDLNTLINARGIKIDPDKDERTYGVFLVEQGADIFKAKVNIEVQIANETSIAAIERNGGTITTGFYDPKSVYALCRPVEYFLQGRPIHKRLLPPQELITYYSDPSMRGYLSDPAEVTKARIELAERFGYVLPDITKSEDYDMLMMRKDPRQVFFGLSPGWIVNLSEKVVIKPDSEFMEEYLTQ